MSFFFQYLLRLSVCFAVMYLFYALMLRRLTFYNHNRWYLLGYSLLCFLIPLISIPSFSQSSHGIVYSNFVQMIPAVTVAESVKTKALPSFNPELIITGLFIIGVAVMVTRLLIQFFSFKKLTKNAVMISDYDNVKLYQIDKDIVPFSFGNSIYINNELNDEKTLQEILRHEFVHVKQNHTVDILWSEVLCILNWYNPFVWFIRKAIRENLEFIADDKVVQNGINKQHYQYLLLRVMGNNNFSFTNNFNFSSLKKRIAMMNKIKTAKVHLLKFLFLIPLIGILLVSFRDVIKKDGIENTFAIAGRIFDEDGYTPIPNVHVHDETNNIDITTDKNGFYRYEVKGKLLPGYQHFLSTKKDGYQNFGFEVLLNFDSSYNAKNIISNIFLKNKQNKNDSIYSTSNSSCTKEMATYDEAKRSLIEAIKFLNNKQLASVTSISNKEVEKNNSGNNSKMYSVINADVIKITKLNGDTTTLSGSFETSSWNAPADSLKKLSDNTTSIKDVTIAGIIVDGVSYQPISNVIIKDKNNNRKAITDNKGYYSFNMSFAKYNDKERFPFSLQKNGFLSMAFPLSLTQAKDANGKYILFDVGMKANSTPDSSACTFASYNSNFKSIPNFRDANNELNEYIKQRNKHSNL